MSIDNPSFPDDALPVLEDLVTPEKLHAILEQREEAVQTPAGHEPAATRSPENLQELVDTLYTTLSRELDYAIEGAVYERFQSMMEATATDIKNRVRTQLEELLPQLIEAAIRNQKNDSPTH